MPKADDEGEVAVMPTFLRKFFFILFLVFVFWGGNPARKEMHYGNKAKIMSQI